MVSRYILNWLAPGKLTCSRLYANGLPDKAKDMLIKSHGDGQLTPAVQMQLDQLAASISSARPASRRDYRGLVNTRSKRYRLMLGG
jgi:hypothetical protein